MNCCTRKRENNQIVPFLMRKLTYKVMVWLLICQAVKGRSQKDARLPNATLPSILLIPYLVGCSGRHYKVMTWDILSSYRPGMESLHGTGHICDILQDLCRKKNGNKSTYFIDINERMTIKSMHRSCVPMCSPTIPLSSEYRGQLCCQPREGR